MAPPQQDISLFMIYEEIKDIKKTLGDKVVFKDSCISKHDAQKQRFEAEEARIKCLEVEEIDGPKFNLMLGAVIISNILAVIAIIISVAVNFIH